MLAEYNRNPYELESAKITFAEIYTRWSEEKYPTISDSNIKGYKAAYNCFAPIHNRIFKNLKLNDLQMIVDNCGKNYPMLRKLKVLLNQLYEYGMKFEICTKDFSEHVDIAKFKDKNPNKIDRMPFTNEEIEKLWGMANNPYVQIVLMLIYSGVRISELLELDLSFHLDGNLMVRVGDYFNVPFLKRAINLSSSWHEFL